MTASTYDGRLAMAGPHERAVTAALRDLGWYVAPFGELLTPETRAAMAPWRSLLRYLPDLIAVRRPLADAPEMDLDVDGVRLVDAKAGRTDTPNYDAANGALLAYQRWQLFDVDVWLVFPDLRCARAVDMWTSPNRRAGADHGTGSRLPYSLLPKSDPCVVTLADAFRNPAGGALSGAPSH